MSRLCIETRNISSWRDRLASPDTQWRRGYSAFETAVSWQVAALSSPGLPEPIARLFRDGGLGQPELALAVAEHKVPLSGLGDDSQCDVWALVKVADGLLSLSVEAKAREGFGNGHEPLRAWLRGGKSKNSAENRGNRWRELAGHLPVPTTDYHDVPFQLLHRCGAAVIEARRIGLSRAAFVVQAFNAPETSFEAYCRFGAAIGVELARTSLWHVTVPASAAGAAEVHLAIGWADCAVATDTQVAAVSG